MTLFNAIIFRLKNDATVAAQLSGRIYANRAPQNTAIPFVTIETIAVERNHHLSGSSEMTSTTLQFDCIGLTPDVSKATAEILRKNMDAMSGVTIGDTGVEVFIRASYLSGQRDDMTAPSDGSDVATYRTSLDFEFWHIETLP